VGFYVGLLKKVRETKEWLAPSTLRGGSAVRRNNLRDVIIE
jgi:hypothetical protein